MLRRQHRWLIRGLIDISLMLSSWNDSGEETEEDSKVLTIIELIFDEPKDQGTLHRMLGLKGASGDLFVPFQLQILLDIDVSRCLLPRLLSKQK